MTFLRLGRGDAVAFVAALALLLVMPLTWYTTAQGEQDRQFQHDVVPQVDRQEVPSPSEQAAQAAATQERSAWRPAAAVDWLLLLVLLAAAAAAIAAGFLRAAGKAPPRGVSLSAVASLLAALALALIAYRILEPPGLREAAIVKAGAWLALVCTAALAVGARLASVQERRGDPAAPAAEPVRTEAPVP